MAEQVREGQACEGDVEFVGVRPVHLNRLPRFNDLGKEHLFGRAVVAAPRLHAALEGAQGTGRQGGRSGAELRDQVLEERLGFHLRSGGKEAFRLGP